MFSQPQHTSSELQQYNYFVMQESVFEEKIEVPVFTDVYKENGVLYCASSTSEGVYWYTYCLNNPLVYTDPDGESFAVALVFAIWGVWKLGVHAGSAAEQAGGDFWQDGFWKGAIVGGAAGALGGSGIAPLGTEWLGTTLWGAGLGTATQAGGIWAMGGEDYSQIWQGALIGGAMGFMASEQFGNWTGGKGFASNNQVLMNFEAGKYDITGFDTWQDAALDHFGFEGKYDPNSEHFSRNNPEPAFTNKTTGEISYSDAAFNNNSDAALNNNFDKLYATYDHEIAALQNFKCQVKMPRILVGIVILFQVWGKTLNLQFQGFF